VDVVIAGPNHDWNISSVFELLSGTIDVVMEGADLECKYIAHSYSKDYGPIVIEEANRLGFRI